MTHIMVDLETLSTRHNAAILAIGAVKFDAKRKVYDKFYQVVDTDSIRSSFSDVTEEGFDVSADTLNWWTKQSDEAKAVFSDPNKVTIHSALTAFSEWAVKGTDVREIRIWGNGASFDNVILATAYDITGLRQPWMFYNDRCYRTMKNMHPIVQLTRTGTHHNAVDDAETQAIHLLAMEIPLG